MKILTVDIGNSRIKWFDGKKYYAIPYKKQDIGLILTHYWSHYPKPEHIMVSDVSNLHAAVSSWCMNRWEMQVQCIEPNKTLGQLTFVYKNSEQLGVDRQLAMLAAWNQIRKAVCVIDAGTALTMDFVDADGNHNGGFIVPGYQLMLTALRSGTHALEIDTLNVATLGLGVNTQQCITQGCMAMLSDFCDARIKHYTQQSGCVTKNIITGGHAEDLQKFIQASCVVQPYLVLQGIMDYKDLQ